MLVQSVACLEDNFAYLVWADGSSRALVVDPADAEPVLAAAERLGLTIAGILCTHHHWDHIGGNEELCRRAPSLPVCGHASDAGRIPHQTVRLEHGSVLELEGLSFRVLHVPGHTAGALAYAGDDAVFTGDTLFAAGCGRLFEGTAAQMYESLNVKLATLPASTRVYFGHEYTESNLRFAAQIEPGNAAVREKLARVEAECRRGLHSTPSTIEQERATNPFLRCESPEIVRAVADRLGDDRSPVAVLAAVRAQKDVFR